MYNNGCVVTKGGSLVSVFDMLYHANTIVHVNFSTNKNDSSI